MADINALNKDALMEMIKEHEGFFPFVYPDPLLDAKKDAKGRTLRDSDGVPIPKNPDPRTWKAPTIGYGLNLADESNRSILEGMGYNIDELLDPARYKQPQLAEPDGSTALAPRVDIAIQDAKDWFGEAALNRWPESTQRRLIDLSFNQGASKLKDWKGLKRAAESGTAEQLGKEYKNSDFYGQTGKRAREGFDAIISGEEASPQIAAGFGSVNPETITAAITQGEQAPAPLPEGEEGEAQLPPQIAGLAPPQGVVPQAGTFQLPAIGQQFGGSTLPRLDLPKTNFSKGSLGELQSTALIAARAAGLNIDRTVETYGLELQAGGKAMADKPFVEKDFQDRQANVRLNMQNSLISPMSTPEDVVGYMEEYQGLQRDPYAMDKLAVAGSVQEGSLNTPKRSFVQEALEGMQRNQIAQSFSSQLMADIGIGDVAEMFGREIFLLNADSRLTMRPGRLLEMREEMNRTPPDQVADLLEKFKTEIDDAGFTGVDDVLTASMLDLVVNGNEKQIAIAEIEMGIDAASILGIAAKPFIAAARGVRTLTRSTKLRMDTNNTTEIVDDIVNGTENVVSDAEKVQVTSKLKQQTDDTLSVSGDVDALINKNSTNPDAIIDELPTQGEIDPSTAARQQMATIESGFKTNRLGAARWVDDGKLEFEVMKDNGKPFKTQAAAQRYLDRSDISNSAATVEYKNGGYVVKVKSDFMDAEGVAEFGLARRTLDAAWNRFLGNVDTQQTRRLLRAARFSESRAAASIDAANKKLRRSYGKLSAGQKVRLNKFMERGTDEGKWYKTKEEADQIYMDVNKNPLDENVKPMSDKQWEAYQTLRGIHDDSFRLNNAVIFQRLARDGFKTMTLKGRLPEAVNAKSVPFTAGVGKHVIGPDNQVIKLGAYKDLENRGYRLVELSSDDAVTLEVKGIVNENAKYMIVKNTDVKFSALKPVQLAYREGGPRQYDLVGKVAQAVVKTRKDGTKYRLPDRTINAAHSIKNAKEFAETVNGGLRVLRDLKAGRISEAEADEIIRASDLDAHLDVTDLDDFEDWVQWELKGDFEHDLHGVGNRERAIVDDEIGDDLSAVEEWQEAGWSRWNSPRGEKLKYIDGDDMETVPSAVAVSKSFEQAAKFSNFESFRNEFTRDMANTVGKWIDKGDKELSFTDALEAPLNPRTPPEIAQFIERQRDYAKHMLGHKTQEQIQNMARMNGFWRGVAANITPADSNSVLLNKLAGGIETAGAKIDRAIAGSFTFGRHMLLFGGSVASGTLQAVASVTTLTAKAIGGSPLSAAKAAQGIVPAMGALIYRTPEARIAAAKVIGEKLALKGVAAPKDMEDRMRMFLRNAGNALDVNTWSLGEGANITSTIMNRKLDQLGDLSKSFFNMGETVNRWTAGSMAYDDALEAGFKAGTEEFAKFHADKMQKYLFGFTRADVQKIFRHRQEPLTDFLRSGAGMFKSMPLRLLSAPLSREWTTKESSALVIGSMLAWGAGSAPFAGEAFDAYMTQNFGMNFEGFDEMMGFEEGTSRHVFGTGFFNAMFSEAFGVEVDMSDRVSMNGVFRDVVQAYQDQSLSEFFGGTLSTGFARVDAMAPVLRTLAWIDNPNMDTTVATGEAVVRSALRGVDEAFRATQAYQEGVLESRGGLRLSTEVAQEGALAEFLGFPLAAKTDAYAYTREDKKYKQKVTDMAKTYYYFEKGMTESQAKGLGLDDYYDSILATLSQRMESDGVRADVAREVKGLRERDSLFEGRNQQAYERAIQGLERPTSQDQKAAADIERIRQKQEAQ